MTPEQSPYQPRPQTPHYVDHSGQQTQRPVPPLETPIYGDQQGAPQAHEYAFIMDTAKPSTKRSLPGGNSLPIKIGYGAGGLILLIIVLAFGKSLFSGGNNFPQFITIAADQQELIKLTTTATTSSTTVSTSAKTQAFMYTTQLGITSAQTDTLNYLAKNGKKVGPKQLATKLSATTDSQLIAAQTAGNYETVFHDVMKDKLTDYRSDIKATYATTKGPNGKKLLDKQYGEAGLLLKQLDTK